MIDITDIHKRFGNLEVLKGVSLHVNKGEIVSIIGPSGAGKTTLLQIIGTLDRPNSGKVVIDHNPCVRWCFNNVELKTDWNGNVKPIKSGGENNNKIDPIIAMVQALGVYYDKVGNHGDGEVLYVKN